MDGDLDQRLHELQGSSNVCRSNLGTLLRDRGDVAGAVEQFVLGELSGDDLAARNLSALRDDCES